jgi:hypothetical protein
MSNATFPQGIRNGYNMPIIGGYKSWKPNNVPRGILPVNRPPLLNKDSGNNFGHPFGKPRPLKIYRKQRIIYASTVGLPPNVANSINYFSSPTNPIVSAPSLGGITQLTVFNYPGSHSPSTYLSS